MRDVINGANEDGTCLHDENDNGIKRVEMNAAPKKATSRKFRLCNSMLPFAAFVLDDTFPCTLIACAKGLQWVEMSKTARKCFISIKMRT